MEEPLEQEVNQGTKQIIVFKMAGEEYALDIQYIKEVVPTPPISKVPLTADYIRGVANIRGSIIAIVDLEEKFKLPTQRQKEVGQYTLVVEGESVNMAFLVHEIPNTFTVPVANIDQSPAILQETTSEKNYVEGIIKLEKRLIILIDIQSIISKGEIQSVISPQ